MKTIASVCVLLIAARAGAEELRVCADPENLPYSSERLDGLENKIAEVVASELGTKVAYTWYPAQRGLVKRFLNAGKCDVLLGVPTGFDPVLWTKPYYRASYMIAVRRDRGIRVTSLDDPALRTLRVGVLVNTPPHDALGRRGIAGANVIGYQLMFDPRSHPEDYPGRLMEDLIAGKLDVALVWGPIGGYFAHKAGAAIELTPLEEGAGDRYAFSISMGVRKGAPELRARLDEALVRRKDDIHRILEEYGVPLLPEAR